jgi:RNA polymerase sigma-70 factor (ECF subfamily)
MKGISMSRATNAEIIAAAKTGDESAWQTIYLQYHSWISKIIYNIVENHEIAEELMQETFLSAYRKVGQFRSEAALSTWLYRIAVNHAFMYMRTKRPETVEMPEDLLDYAIPGFVVNSSVIDKKCLQTALSGLTDRRRKAFIWKEMEGLSHIEIGKLLGITKNGSKSLVLFAKRDLRKSLITQGYKRT